MIERTENTLEAGRESDLRKWLERPECKLLISVVESKAKRHLIKSTEEALTVKAYPDKLQLANSDLENAIRYKDFLAILKEIRESREPFSILTLK